MLEELAPEIIWAAGLGTVVVLGLMMVVWFVSTREEKKRDSPPQANLSVSKTGKVKKKQYGSPRKKKEVLSEAVIQEHSDTEAPSTEPTGEFLPVTTVPVEETLVRQKENEESKKKTKPSKTQHQTHETDVKPPPAPEVKTPPVVPQAAENKSPSVKTQLQERKPPSAKEPKFEESRPSPKKVKTKVKQSTHHSSSVSSEVVMSGSKIAEAIANSPLSEEEVQIVMEKLLEKQSEEWEAAGRADSIKSLKKTNEELATRARDAEKSAQSHSARVKELGLELKQERSRLSASETAFQAKLAKQQEDLDNLKKSVQRYRQEAESRQGQDMNGELARLQESNQTYLKQLSQLAMDKSQLNAELSTQIKQYQDIQNAFDEASRKLANESDKLSTAQRENKQLFSEISNNREEIRKLTSELNVARETQRKASTSEESAVDQEKVELRKELEALKKKYQEKELALQESEQSQKNLQGDSTKTSLELQTAKESLRQLEDSVNSKVTELKEVREKMTSLGEKLQLKDDEIKQLSKTLDEKEEALKKEKEAVPVQPANDVTEMQSKIDDLKKKNDVLREQAWKTQEDLEVANRNVTETKDNFKDFLKSAFPLLKDDVADFDGWLQYAKEWIPKKLSESETDSKQKNVKIEEMKKEIEEGTAMTNELRDTLSDTLSKLEDLMKKWEEKEKGYNSTINEERTQRQSIDKELISAKEKIEKLSSDNDRLTSQFDALRLEKESLVKDHESALQAKTDSLQLLINEEKAKAAAEQDKEKESLEQAEKKLAEVAGERDTLNNKLKETEKKLLDLAAEKETLNNQLGQFKTEVNDFRQQLDEKDKLIESLRAANQDFNQRMSKLSPPPTVSSASSDV
ncbi:PREDICTED: restin homolog [Amphimedon queenslandica]|uniref:Ribosome receptor lysine/proline rich domain-containing protein n=1 Tax=Amphimedon queenslandica TaxID=400682 RepID=A0A1X7UKD9_AMPQE|nr:PREDICTED: restin homolog [Amphimedon queenslandica]|eukprot:XP_003387608.1 PREDICTED: restin homolog [Amphimedon queenslandica]